MFDGIPVRRCKYIEPGKAYFMAQPTRQESLEYRVDVLTVGEDRARERLLRKIAPRSVVIHNIGE